LVFLSEFAVFLKIIAKIANLLVLAYFIVMNKNQGNSKIFKALCDETRLEIIELLKNGEKCACVLLKKVKIGQPTLSHHMKILVRSKFVSARKEGKWMYYSISQEGSEYAINLLKTLTTVTEIEGDDENAICCGT
jgi:ArsR family transcriptional regulator